MATTNQPSKAPEKAESDKSSDVSVRTAEAQTRPNLRENAREMVKHRGDHQSARDAAVEANQRLAEELKNVTKNSTPAEEVGVSTTVNNQVPQEGALVETPPQPIPPSYTEAELAAMDHAPLGMREPSVAADASSFEDYDQTVHPKARVDDPRFPL